MGGSTLRLSLRQGSPTMAESEARDIAPVIDSKAAADARSVIRRWEGYAPTPLVPLNKLATQLGVKSVWCKDESGRFGLGSFKSLGGAFGVLRALQDEIEGRTKQRPSAEELWAGHPEASLITTTTASAGNHGRSVAWGSSQFGCTCVVVLPEDAHPARAQAIESHGAQVVRFEGSYDEAVGYTEREAERNGWLIVSDTAYDGYEETPMRIMEGYTVLADEMLQSLAAESVDLTHLFIQTGVGGLATGVCSHLVKELGVRRPRFIAVEPWRADCFGRSLRSGKQVFAEPPFETEMGGLAAGIPSTIAWTFLGQYLDAALALPESVWQIGAMALGTGELGARIAAGPSGASGVGALVALTRLPGLAKLLDFQPDSQVGALITEARFY